MNVYEFLQGSEGRWFSQRTGYQLGQTEQWHRSDKTQVFSEFLAPQTAALLEICTRYQLPANQALCGLKSWWEKTYFKPAGSTVMVPLANRGSSTQGRLLWITTGTPQPQEVTYELGMDQTLTLQWPESLRHAQERIWFASPKLRLRTSLVRGSNQRYETSAFYSEIRLGNLPEKGAQVSESRAQV